MCGILSLRIGAGGAGDGVDVAEQLVVLGGDAIERGGQFVDYVRIILGQRVLFGVVRPQARVVFLQLSDPVLEFGDLAWVAPGRADAGSEPLGEIALFVGEQSAFDVGLDRELDDGQLSVGSQRGAGEQPVGGGLDRGAFLGVDRHAH